MVKKPRAERYYKLNQAEFDELNLAFKNKITGWWVLVFDDGTKCYNFKSPKDAQEYAKLKFRQNRQVYL